MRLNSAISCFDSFGPPHGLPGERSLFGGVNGLTLTRAKWQVCPARYWPSGLMPAPSAHAAQQWVPDGGQPDHARQWAAEDYRHGQVVTLHTSVIPHIPHGFAILDDVQAAPLADSDHKGLDFGTNARSQDGLRSLALRLPSLIA